MNMTEKNGQPSMEEILASIRRIIAEEPASQTHGDFRGGQPIMLKGDGVLDDAGDFDLPAIFRSSPSVVQDRPAPLLGRLTDAIRGASAQAADELAEADASSANGDGATRLRDDVTGEPIHDYASLSSLKTVRTRGPHVSVNGSESVNGGMNGHAAHGGGVSGGMNGSAAINGHSHFGAPAPAPVQASASSGDEPKREMAPFKDTKFMRMSSGPASAPAVVPEPVPAAGMPVEMTAAPAPVEMPMEPVEPEAVQPVPEADAFLMPPQMVATPPPPLPAEALGDGAGEGVGSIEDTTADLLRPMLRQWLADNMPRMVEKALHIEIAESVKPPKKP